MINICNACWEKWRSLMVDRDNYPGACPVALLFCCCSVAKSYPTLCEPMDCSVPGFCVFHHLLELAQTHVHWVSDAIQPSHSLSSPSPPAFSLSQNQGLFQCVGSSYQVAKILELQQWPWHLEFSKFLITSNPFWIHELEGCMNLYCSSEKNITLHLPWVYT